MGIEKYLIEQAMADHPDGDEPSRVGRAWMQLADTPLSAAFSSTTPRASAGAPQFPLNSEIQLETAKLQNKATSVPESPHSSLSHLNPRPTRICKTKPPRFPNPPQSRLPAPAFPPAVPVPTRQSRVAVFTHRLVPDRSGVISQNLPSGHDIENYPLCGKALFGCLMCR
jgi:hypothetical protein